MFNEAGGPFSKVRALKATGLFSVDRRAFQTDQTSRNLIPQVGDSEFAVTALENGNHGAQIVYFCEMCRTMAGSSVSPLTTAWRALGAAAGDGLHMYRQCCNECT
jgi:hypothetical protein